MKKKEVFNLYRKYINPDFINLLEAFDHGKYFIKAENTKLIDENNREYTDFLAGYGVFNIGHNHPELIKAIHDSLDLNEPTFLNIDAPLKASLLAKKLTELTHPSLCRTLFANSGAEAVEIAIKAVKSATGRDAIISCNNCYHGLTTGAISLMGDKYKKYFGHLLNDIYQIDYADLEALENICIKTKPAAFFFEPIQGEGGINIPSGDFFKEASKICKKHGVLMVSDEVQTGLGRCGKMFETPFKEFIPDILIVGKALSGGLIPVTGTIMTRNVFKKAFSGPIKSNLNSSTFAEGTLAMTAGLKTIEIIENEKLCEKSKEKGEYFLEKLKTISKKFKIIKEIRGKGLFIGIEFLKPTGIIKRTIPKFVRNSLYSYVISAILLRDYAIITQPCSNYESVIKIEPPLTISNEEIDFFVNSLEDTILKVPTHRAALKSAFKKSFLKMEL